MWLVNNFLLLFYFSLYIKLLNLNKVYIYVLYKIEMMGNKDYKNCFCDYKNYLKYVWLLNLGKIRKVVVKIIFRIYFYKMKYVFG